MDEKVGIEITDEDNVAVVSFKTASIIDANEIRDACQEVQEFIDGNHPSRLVFDFEGVKFFSSHLLGLLLEVHAKVQAYSAEVVISAINPQLHRIFRITNLDKVFSFFPDREKAVRG
ncbi:MAG: STAS domain-containing protein [Planctomycetota bacterium]|jgi:anti-anti-sigma factor